MKNYKTDRSIYAKDNKYGFVININNPLVHKLYLHYLKKLDIPAWVGLTDKQRHSFEGMIGEMIRQKIIIVRR